MAIGRREQISVYGSDYQTRDGTGDRDYVHVVDLAEGHVKAVDHILEDTRWAETLMVNIIFPHITCCCWGSSTLKATAVY